MNIQTSHDRPPIPTRDADWSAVDQDTYDGAEDAHPSCQIIGRGPTERDALIDLMEQTVGYYEGRAAELDEIRKNLCDAVSIQANRAGQSDAYAEQSRAALERIASRKPYASNGGMACPSCGTYWHPDPAVIKWQEEHHHDTCAYVIASTALSKNTVAPNRECGAATPTDEVRQGLTGPASAGDAVAPATSPECSRAGNAAPPDQSPLGVGNSDPLPCKVYCEAGPAFGAGVPISTLLGYFKRREKYNADDPLKHTCGLPEREWSREGPSKDCPLCKARADFRDLRGLIERASSDTPGPDTEDRITRDRRDAERYRFLREGRPGVYNNVMCWALDRLDAEVDAAMGYPTKSVPSQENPHG